MDGFINILKPPGISSHDIVNIVRKIFNMKKVGHGGTLDPGAAGVLVIGIGQATRLLEYIVNTKKCYRAEITFGMTTSSQDSFGKKLNESNAVIDENKLSEALKCFEGDIFQTPPMDSALRYKGKRLYDLSREGIEVEREKRAVTIYKTDVVKFYSEIPYKALIDIECSKGTYVRTICSDIGDYLGVGAYMSFLVRRSVGDFLLEDSITIDELSEMEKVQDKKYLQPITKALSKLPFVKVKKSFASKVLNGVSVIKKDIESYDKIKENETVLILSEEDKLLALGKVASEKGLIIKPIKTFKKITDLS